MATITETIRNGVDTQQMYGTLDAIKAQPELGRFEFRELLFAAPPVAAPIRRAAAARA